MSEAWRTWTDLMDSLPTGGEGGLFGKGIVLLLLTKPQPTSRVWLGVWVMCFPSPPILSILPSPPSWHAHGLLLGRREQPIAFLFTELPCTRKTVPASAPGITRDHIAEPAIRWSLHGLGRQRTRTLQRETQVHIQLMRKSDILLTLLHPCCGGLGGGVDQIDGTLPPDHFS